MSQLHENEYTFHNINGRTSICIRRLRVYRHTGSGTAVGYPAIHQVGVLFHPFPPPPLVNYNNRMSLWSIENLRGERGKNLRLVWSTNTAVPLRVTCGLGAPVVGVGFRAHTQCVDTRSAMQRSAIVLWEKKYIRRGRDEAMMIRSVSAVVCSLFCIGSLQNIDRCVIGWSDCLVQRVFLTKLRTLDCDGTVGRNMEGCCDRKCWNFKDSSLFCWCNVVKKFMTQLENRFEAGMNFKRSLLWKKLFLCNFAHKIWCGLEKTVACWRIFHRFPAGGEFSHIIQIVYLTFERLWNLARETSAPVWSLSKVFMSKNLVIKSLQKIWSENGQKRRPRGSSIKHGEIWPAKFGQMCLPQIFQVHLLHLSGLKTLFFPVYVNGMTLK